MEDWQTTLFSPYEVGGVALRNRIVVPGHTTNFGFENRPTEKYANYLAERAKGGVGLIITEGVRVHQTSAGRHISLGSFSDDSIPAFARVATDVKSNGAAIFAQLLHAGRQANGDATRTAAWAPSAIPWSPGAYPPHSMGKRDIRTVVDSFGKVARRMAIAGLDGVEVHLGHGHLLQQFLSPATNQRSDEYGGSLDNRLRIVREVIESIQTQAPGLPIALRVSANEWLPGGLEPQHVVAIVQELTSQLAPAYLNVSHAAYHASWTLATQMADMSFAHKAFIDHARVFKDAFPQIPILAVCRLDSLPAAAEVITAGDADLVGLVRPHIADPHLALKTIEGRAHEINSCLACNQACIQRVEQSLPISCVVNPEVGFEGEWQQIHREVQAASVQNRDRVLVVGGGPAGMTAALAAHDRGAQVTLVEKNHELGGQIPLVGKLPARERMGLLAEDLTRNIAQRDIEVKLGQVADLSFITAQPWDEVIIATGSVPTQRFESDELICLDIWQGSEVAAGLREIPPGDVVLVDDVGSLPGSFLLEALAKTGRKVHLVSGGAGIASRVTTYSSLGLVKRYQDYGVRAHLQSVATIVGKNEVLVSSKFRDDDIKITGVVAIVDAGSTQAVDDLYLAIEAAELDLEYQIVGDANSPRTAFEAVFEGKMAGTFKGKIESPAARRVASIF